VEVDDVSDCVPFVGYLSYDFGVARAGYVNCIVDGYDNAVIECTDDGYGLYANVSTPGGLDALPALFEWWVSNGNVPGQ